MLLPAEGSGSRDLKAIVNNRYVSPLRYPGGKRNLAFLVADIIQKLPASRRLLIEPFAGGAAVSLALLEAGVVDEILLADRDPLIAGFWKIVFSPHADTLADWILTTTATVSDWLKWRADEPSNDFDRARKCLFLNRTSFSGILNEWAGPIGGLEQKGKYTVDCRLNRTKIARRIRELSALSARVRFVGCQDWYETIRQVEALPSEEGAPQVVWYFDPPFFAKAERLYRFVFSYDDHVAFRSAVESLTGHWIVSYDDKPEARLLWGAHQGFKLVSLTYHARVDSTARNVASEIIVSDIIAKLRAEHRDCWADSIQVERPKVIPQHSGAQLPILFE